MSNTEKSLPEKFTVMFVGAGHLSTRPKLYRDSDIYGSYDDYLKNLKQLYDIAKKYKIPTVFMEVMNTRAELLPKGTYKPFDQYFSPFDNSLVLILDFSEEGWNMEKGIWYKNHHMLYELKLAKDGNTIKYHIPTTAEKVSENLGELLLVAGETATWQADDNSGKPHNGCVGGVLWEFEDYIPIIGVEGAIYPFDSYLKHLDPWIFSTVEGKWVKEMHNKIYDKAVPLEHILSKLS